MILCMGKGSIKNLTTTLNKVRRLLPVLWISLLIWSVEELGYDDGFTEESHEDLITHVRDQLHILEYYYKTKGENDKWGLVVNRSEDPETQDRYNTLSGGKPVSNHRHHHHRRRSTITPPAYSVVSE